MHKGISARMVGFSINPSLVVFEKIVSGSCIYSVLCSFSCLSWFNFKNLD